jgi:restriction system protein
MKFKMAKGSLFAVLLRSTWWYSILIGLVILLISLAATDADYVVLSIIGSMPFFLIGSYAGFKQLQQPSKKRILAVEEEAKTMSSTVIAQKIAANYINNGYESSAFKANTADLLLTKNHRKILLNSKRFKAAKTGIEPLKLLVAAGESIEATGYLYLSLGEVSTNAIDYAKEHKIEIIQLDRLAKLFDGKTKID